MMADQVLRLRPVESSNVSEIGFIVSEGLFVRFRGGGLYRYPEFPADKFSEFASAESFGRYFHANVKSQYEGKLIEVEPVTFGRMAFEAYSRARLGKAVNGDPIPLWHDLDPGNRHGWEAAAEAVLITKENPSND